MTAICLAWPNSMSAQPANDSFPGEVIIGSSGSTNGSTIGASRELGEQLNFVGEGPSVWYTWTSPMTGGVQFSTCGNASYQTAINVFTGSTVDNLDLIYREIYQCEGQPGSKLTFPVVEGNTYFIAVSGISKSSGTFGLEWSTFTTPANDNFPGQLITGESGMVSGVNVNATRETGEPPHYNQRDFSVWYSWTAPITGGVEFSTCSNSDFNTILVAYSGSSLRNLTVITENNNDCDESEFLGSRIAFPVVAGNTYQIVTTGGSYPSGPTGSFTLDWKTYPTPTNDYFPGEILMGDTGFVTGNTIDATRELGEPEDENFQSPSVWYTWTAPISGPVEFYTCTDSSFDSVMSVYTGSSVEELEAVPSGDGYCFNHFGSTMEFFATEGATYRISVAGENEDRGVYSLEWRFILSGMDNFPGEQLIGDSGTITGTTSFASRELGEPNHLRSEGPSLWYRWTAPFTGGVEFSTCNNTIFDSVLVVYTGNSINDLKIKGGNDNWCGENSRIFMPVTEGMTYHIVVTGTEFYTKGTFSLDWRSFEPPSNDHFPGNEIAGLSGMITGTTIDSTIEIEEYEPTFSFPDNPTVWYTWTAPITGGLNLKAFSDHQHITRIGVYTGSSLGALQFIEGNYLNVNFSISAGRTYRIAIYGEIDPYQDFTLYWQTIPAPDNDDFPGFMLTGETGSITGSTIYCSSQSGEPRHSFEFNLPSVWYTWTAPYDGDVEFISLTDETVNTGLAVYLGDTVDKLSLISRSIEGCGAINGSKIFFRIRAGSTYRIAVAKYGSNSGTFKLDWTSRPAPINNHLAAATELSGIVGSTTGTNVSATFEPTENKPSSSYSGNTVWWKWTAPSDTRVSFDTEGSNFSSTLAIYTGEFYPLTPVENPVIIHNYSTQFDFDAQKDTTYLIQVDSTFTDWCYSKTGNIVLNWEAIPYPEGDQLLLIKGHTDDVTSVAYFPDGSKLISGSSDGKANIWDAQNGELLLSIPHPDDVTAIDVSPDGTRILTGCLDSWIRLFDTSGNRLWHANLQSYQNGVNDVAFSPDGTKFAAIGSPFYSDDLRVYNTDTTQEIYRIILSGKSYSARMDFSPAGTEILVERDLFSATNGSKLRTFTYKSMNSDFLGGVRFSPYTSNILVGLWCNNCNDPKPILWDIATDSESQSYSGHGFSPNISNKRNINCVDFSHNGKLVASGSDDHTIRIWDVAQGQPALQVLTGHTNSVRSIDFSPDSRRLASASNDYSVRIWKVNILEEPIGGDLLIFR